MAIWKWDTSDEPHKLYFYGNGGFDDDDDEDDVCGICRLAFESCCPECKMPGDDCPLSEFAGTAAARFLLFCASQVSTGSRTRSRSCATRSGHGEDSG